MLSVRVEDPEAHFEEEMKLVYYEQGVNEEWPFWNSQGNCAKPDSWDMVTRNGEVLLEANQRCPLLFKFLSFREPVNVRDDRGEPDRRILRRRFIRIVIEQTNRSIMDCIEVEIIPCPAPIDHSFKFYKP